MRNLDYGEIENRDDMGFLIGNYHPLDIDVTANYAHRVTPSFMQELIWEFYTKN